MEKFQRLPKVLRQRRFKQIQNPRREMILSGGGLVRCGRFSTAACARMKTTNHSRVLRNNSSPEQ